MEVDLMPSGDGWTQVKVKGLSKWEAYGFARQMRNKGMSTTKPRFREGCWVFRVRRKGR